MIVLLLWLLLAGASAEAARQGPILVMGSLNLDIIIPLERYPSRGETMTALNASATLAVGG